MRQLLAFVIALALCHPALAHMSPKGMIYPTDCCDKEGKECGPIDPKHLTEDENYFYLDLGPEDHHKLTGRVTRKFEKIVRGNWNDRIKFSTDGDTHACCVSVRNAYDIAKPSHYCFCIIIPPRNF